MNLRKRVTIWIFLACGLTMSLTACSYVFDTFSYVRNGQLYFDLKLGQDLPTFGADVNCIRQIKVEVRDRKPVRETFPDGTKVVSYPEDTLWEYGNLRSDCILSFPVKYGEAKNKKLEIVAAKPLRNGVAYTLSIFSSGSGYGGHDFEMKSMVSSIDLPHQ